MISHTTNSKKLRNGRNPPAGTNSYFSLLRLKRSTLSMEVNIKEMTRHQKKYKIIAKSTYLHQVISTYLHQVISTTLAR